MEDGKIATRYMGLCHYCGLGITVQEMYHNVGHDKVHQKCLEERFERRQGNADYRGSGKRNDPDPTS